LDHQFFSKLRKHAFEVSAPHAINLEELDSDLKAMGPLNMSTLKRIIIDEIKFFRNKRSREGPQHLLKPLHWSPQPFMPSPPG
jgi:hypothetical protein